ncbi:MAG: hypothetical protein K8J31_18980 [Anaerolineae bacterium]|nr:hypothetical protein [Anaerolineae bacterium]
MAAHRSEIEYPRAVHQTRIDDFRWTIGAFTRHFLASVRVPLAVQVEGAWSAYRRYAEVIEHRLPPLMAA